MAAKTAPIGVFDSGVGGISVLKELVALLPDENYLYFGDSANAPYGEKSTEEVRKLTLQAAEMLIGRGVKALVVACNTATAAAINILRRTYPETVIIGIEPALKVATDHFPTGHIGIMATAVTLREEKLAHQLERFPEAAVERIGAPGLVELIEQGKADAPETEELLRKCLSPYIGKLDALVLGCTHYPFVKETVGKILGRSVQLLDGGAGTARQTKRCLEQADLLNPGPGSVTVENSLNTPKMLELSRRLLTM
ncbi:MAG: glutamate racemase [Oscillospiraceae bacterium]|nr:glutamate racemase [Oscillospiraceae bacterium]